MITAGTFNSSIKQNPSTVIIQPQRSYPKQEKDEVNTTNYLLVLLLVLLTFLITVGKLIFKFVIENWDGFKSLLQTYTAYLDLEPLKASFYI